MIRLIYLTFIVLLCAGNLYGQDSVQNKTAEYKKEREALLAYKKLYKYADSISKNGSRGFLESDIYRIADSLDNLNPTEYFMQATKLMFKNKFNEASFIYYLGRLRFRYYNTANPEYEESCDGALLGSFEYEVGEPIEMFLTADLDNDMEILKKSVDWYVKHDYKFFSKNRSQQKYLAQSDGLSHVIADLEKNKAKYKIEWDKKREESEKGFDKALKQIDDEMKKQ